MVAGQSFGAGGPHPATVGVLCYPGIQPSEIALPFHLVGGLCRAGRPACAVALVGPGPGTVRLAGGAMVRPDRWLGPGMPAVDTLIVPCGFVASEAFAPRGAVAPLVDAVQAAGRVLMIARTLLQARRAQMLLGAASTWPSGAFCEAVRPTDDPRATAFIADGRLTWAVGPAAATDCLRRLVRECPDAPAPADTSATVNPEIPQTFFRPPPSTDPGSAVSEESRWGRSPHR